MRLEDFVVRALTVPFVEGGRGYEGWDCWGLLVCAYRDVCGIMLPTFDGAYAAADVSAASPRLTELLVGDLGRWTKIEERVPMAGALFNISGRPVHVGLVLDGRRFLHAEKNVGSEVARFSSPVWSRRLEGIYRYDG